MLRSLEVRWMASLVACLAIAIAYPAVAVAQEDQDQEQRNEQRDSDSDEDDRQSNQDDQDEADRDSDRDQSDRNQRDQQNNQARDRDRNQDRDQARQQRDRQSQTRQDRQSRDQQEHWQRERDTFPAPRDSYDSYQSQQRSSQFGRSERQFDSQGDRDAALGVTIDTRDRGEGVVVERIHRDSPAEQMGLREGDRITHINGERVRSPEQFASRIRSMQPGEEVELEVQRNNDERSVSGELESRREALSMQDRDRTRQQGQARQQRQQWESDRGQFRELESYARQGDSQRRSSFQGQARRDQGNLSSQINRIQRQIDRLNEELDELRYSLQRDGTQVRAYRGEMGASYDQQGASYDQQFEANRPTVIRGSVDRWQGSAQPTGNWSGQESYRVYDDSRIQRGPLPGEYEGYSPSTRAAIQGEQSLGGETGEARVRPDRD